MQDLTIEMLEQWYDELNKQVFNGILKQPTLKIGKTVKRLGCYCPSRNYIEVSVKWIRSERDYKNTLLHEMCHQYARLKYGSFIQPHGVEWKRVARMATQKTGGLLGNIQRAGGGQDNKVLDTGGAVYSYLVFTDFRGNQSICRYSGNYAKRLRERNCVMKNTEIQYYTSPSPKFARLPLKKDTRKRVSWYYFNTYYTQSEFFETATLVKREKHSDSDIA